MIVTVLNAGMSLGSFTGGVALNLEGVKSLPWVSLVVFAAALVIAAAARRHAFPAPSARASAQSTPEPELQQ